MQTRKFISVKCYGLSIYVVSPLTPNKGNMCTVYPITHQSTEEGRTLKKSLFDFNLCTCISGDFFFKSFYMYYICVVVILLEMYS